MAGELISGVPNEITVGLIGAIGGLVGAGAGAFVSWLTTRAQIGHDREQRERERVFSLRRDVFLDFAEAATKPLVALSRISNAEVPMDELILLQQSTMGPAAKLHGVARLSTIRVLLAANECMAGAWIALILKRMEVDKLTWWIKATEGQIENARRQRAQFTESIHSLSRLPQPQMDRINELLGMINSATADEAKLAEHRAKLTLERSQLQVGLASESTTMSGEYSRCLARLNVAMREEMDMPLSDGYEELLMESCDRIQKKQADFTKHLSAELDSLRDQARIRQEAQGK